MDCVCLFSGERAHTMTVMYVRMAYLSPIADVVVDSGVFLVKGCVDVLRLDIVPQCYLLSHSDSHFTALSPEP